MTKHLKNIWTMMSSLCIAASSTLSADAYIENINHGPTYGYGVPAPFPGQHQYQDNCNPCSSWCDGFIVGVDVLYWKPCQEGIPYASSSVFVPDEAEISVPLGKSFSEDKKIEFDWNTGVRVSLGKKWGCDCVINSALEWTHYRNSSRAHAHNRSFDGCCDSTAINFLIPSWGLPFVYGDAVNGTFENPTEIRAKWKLHLDLLDFVFSKDLNYQDCVTFTPYIGARGGWINQSLHINVDSVQTSGTDPVVNRAERNDVLLRTEFKGGGIKGGFGTNWNLGCNLCLYGDFGGSVLYGEYNNKSSQRANDFFEPNSTAETTLASALKSESCGSLATLDLGIGLSYCVRFCEDSMGFRFKLGWEQHVFFDHCRFENPSEDLIPILASNETGVTPFPQHNNQRFHDKLSVQGVTFSLNFDF